MNEKEIVQMYVEKNLSTHAIAKIYNTYPNKIKRILNKLGIQLNNKSLAQKLAIKSGRTKHPTKGTKRNQETKNKISDSVHNNWKKLSQKEYQKRVDTAKKQWYNMTENERDNLKNAAAKAVRQAARNGSKMEIFLTKMLQQEGYDTIFHKTGLIPNDNLEVDIFIPAINTAIEIDGPAHFFPIWGEDNLQKHISADNRKTGLLLNHGFVIIRIKHLTKNLSEKNKREVFDCLMVELKRIEQQFPPKRKRYIELEVN
jgi:very-short-patch-repair endonuclease